MPNLSFAGQATGGNGLGGTSHLHTPGVAGANVLFGTSDAPPSISTQVSPGKARAIKEQEEVRGRGYNRGECKWMDGTQLFAKPTPSQSPLPPHTQLIGSLKKENFNLKLRIYHMEDSMKKYGDGGDAVKHVC